MKNVKLDRVDLTILSELQKNGRITNVDLAAKAGLSAPPCLRRLRALEEEGYITGYHTDVDPLKLGYGMMVYIHVGLANHAENDLIEFAALVETWPEVQESYMLTGDSDFLLKIVAKNWNAFQAFLTSKLAASPNVNHVKSFPIVRRTKYAPGVPIQPADVGDQ